MKKITLWLFALFSCWQISAQVSSYSFSHQVGTFTENSTSATTISGVRADTFISLEQPIGFDFVYEGTTYTQFKMSSNGFISFNITGTSALTGNDFSAANATSRPVIAPLWDDLDGGDISSSLASYEVTGSAPNRVLTVEWKNWQWNYTATTNPTISFQVKLYETTNIIEFVYRQESGAVSSGSASIGIGSAIGSGVGSYLNLTGISTPDVSSATSVTNISTKPVTGQIYRFTPPTPCNGEPLGGTVSPASQTLVLGQVPTPITVLGQTTGVSSLVYQWEESTDGLTWNNAIGGTGVNTLAYIPPTFTGTEIMYRLKITCETTDESAYSTVATLSGCVAIDTFFENFESTTGSNFSTCWTKVGTSGTANTQASVGISGARNLYMYSSAIGSRPVVAMPPVSNGGDETHRMVMKVRGNFSAGETIELGYLTNPTDASTFTVINSIVTNSATVPQTFTTIPTGLTSSDNTVFALRTGTALLSVLIDDISWEQLPSCPDQTGLVVANIRSTQVDTSWDNLSAYGATGYEYAITTLATPPASGTITQDTYYEASGLSPQTQYYLHVRAVCGVGEFGVWATSAPFTTLCAAVTILPYTENFDTYGTGSTAFPSCWARPVINSGYPSIVNINAAPLSTVNSLRFQSAAGTPTYAISPAFAEDIHNLRVKFSLRREGPNSGTIDIGVMSNPSDLSTFEVVQTINPSNDIFNAYTFDLDGTVLAGENNYIAVRHNSILGNWYYWLDNFVVELIPACPDQTGLVVGNITATGADFSWDDMSSVGDVTYEYAITTSATPPASGEPTEDTFHIATNELTPQTVYYLHVRVVCDIDSFGNWATSAPFTTLCVPFTNLPYTENFDTGSSIFPACWSRPVIYNGYPSIVAANPVSAPNSLRFQSDVGVPTYAISPAFAEDIHNLRVKFSLKREGPNSGTIDIGVMSNPSDLSTFEVVQTINPANDNHTAYVFNLNATVLTGGNRYVAIRHNTILNNWYYWVDNFVVELIPACADQTGLVVGNISATGAEMSWDNMSVNGYEYAVTTSATPPTSGTFTAATFYEAINNLDPLTVYYLHVRTDCGNGDFGIWVSTSFKTLCLPPNITGTTPGAVCGQGSVALSATSDNGTIAWYAAQTGGVALSTGATFNTPVITGTTSYWVAAFAGQNGVGGRLAPASTAGTTPSTYGLVFTATNDFTLNTVDVYLRGTSAGNLVVNLTNNSGTVLDTRTIAVPAGNATTPVQHTIALNFNITPGTYRLLAISGPDMVRESALGGYPYPVGDVASITDGYILGTSTAYYYFYNWAYTSGCASPRTEVVATVTTAPVLTLSDASVTVCDGNPSDAITVTAGSSDYDVFVWQPATNVSGDATNGWTFTATESGVYTLTASNSVTGCVSTKEVTIVAGQSPVLNMPEELSACSGNVTELNSGVNNISAEFINETFSGGTTFPSGWTAVVGAGDAVAVVNNNTAGGTANEVKITGNSQTANVTNRVYYGPINTSGLSELTLQWNNYLYHYQATYNYSVRIQTSSDGVTWNDTNWVFSPVTATQAASVVQTTIATSDVGSSTFYVSFTNQGQTFGMHNWNIDNVILSGEVNHEVTWSPATNLYTDAAGTIPYVGGTNAPIVYFLGNGGSYSYTAFSASSTGCQTSESIDVTVADAPDAPAALSPQTLNGGQTLADLVVTATGSLTWYSDAGLTNQISSTTEAVDGTTYYVTQTVGSCTSDATPITVDVNLGNGNFDSVIFKVYPNPTKNILNISCNQDISSIEVYNMVGQRVNNMVLNANEGKIDMSNLASGAYFVKVTSNDATKTVKVIKE